MLFRSYVGQQEINGIDAGRRDPTNRGTAQAAKIIGIVMTVIVGVVLGFYVLLFVFAGAANL